jgi:hypothetical protein
VEAEAEAEALLLLLRSQLVTTPLLLGHEATPPLFATFLRSPSVLLPLLLLLFGLPLPLLPLPRLSTLLVFARAVGVLLLPTARQEDHFGSGLLPTALLGHCSSALYTIHTF